MTVSAEFFAQHIEDILAVLSEGETVEVERAGKGILRLAASPLHLETPEGTDISTLPERQRTLGAAEGEMPSISWEEWQRIDREWKKDFLSDADLD